MSESAGVQVMVGEGGAEIFQEHVAPLTGMATHFLRHPVKLDAEIFAAVYDAVSNVLEEKAQEMAAREVKVADGFATTITAVGMALGHTIALVVASVNGSDVERIDHLTRGIADDMAALAGTVVGATLASTSAIRRQ